jgi:hypothetical protein
VCRNALAAHLTGRGLEGSVRGAAPWAEARRDISIRSGWPVKSEAPSVTDEDEDPQLLRGQFNILDPPSGAAPRHYLGRVQGPVSRDRAASAA